jgi:hypothetical protein
MKQLVEDPTDASASIDRNQNTSFPVPLGNRQDIPTKFMKTLSDNLRLVVFPSLDDNPGGRWVLGKVVRVFLGVDDSARGTRQDILFGDLKKDHGGKAKDLV